MTTDTVGQVVEMWLKECRRALEDVATEMRARGRGDDRFQTLLAYMPTADRLARIGEGEDKGIAVAWQRPTPYGMGYSFKNEATLRDMADWLTPVQGWEAVQLTKCCGREECGGECGNEWRGMEWVRVQADTPPPASREGGDPLGVAIKKAGDFADMMQRGLNAPHKPSRYTGAEWTEEQRQLCRDAMQQVANHEAAIEYLGEERFQAALTAYEQVHEGTDSHCNALAAALYAARTYAVPTTPDAGGLREAVPFGHYFRAMDGSQHFHTGAQAPSFAHSEVTPLYTTIPPAGDGVRVPDGVFVSRPLAETAVIVAREWLDLFAETPGLEKYDRYIYGPQVELLRDDLTAKLAAAPAKPETSKSTAKRHAALKGEGVDRA